MASRLYRVVEEENGVAMIRCGFVLARDPDTVRAPDVSVVVASRWRQLARDPDFYCEGAPDLAVDVCDPSDPGEPIAERADDLLAAGTRLVWIVDPKIRTVTVRAAGQRPRKFREGDGMLDGTAILPGLVLPVAEFFRD